MMMTFLAVAGLLLSLIFWWALWNRINRATVALESIAESLKEHSPLAKALTEIRSRP